MKPPKMREKKKTQGGDTSIKKEKDKAHRNMDAMSRNMVRSSCGKSSQGDVVMYPRWQKEMYPGKVRANP